MSQKDDLISRQAAIDKFIDGLEKIFADLRERHVDDSVCGLCEYDGAYLGQSGDWCNECPGFDKDDCFKLSDKTRKKWTDEIIKAFPSAQPEADKVARDIATIIENEKDMRVVQKNAEQQWIPCKERLPEISDKVLCCDVYGLYLIGHLYKDDKSETGYSANDYEGCWVSEVVAWMPLPEPYKEK